MTYRELRKAIHDLTEEQLDQEVLVEFGESDAKLRGELRICSKDESPVIYVAEV